MYAVTAYWLDLLSDLDTSTQVHTLLQQAHVYSCQVTFTSSPWSLGHFTPPFDASTHPCVLAVCMTTSATVHLTPPLPQIGHSLLLYSACLCQSHRMRQTYIWLVLSRLKPLLLDFVSLTQRIKDTIRKTEQWLYHTWHLYRFPSPYRKNHKF